MVNFIVTLESIVFSVFILVCLYFLYKWSAQALISSYFLKIIILFYAFKIVAYYLLPAVLRFLDGYSLEIEKNISLEYLSAIYLLEAVAVLLWIAGIITGFSLLKIKSESVMAQSRLNLPGITPISNKSFLLYVLVFLIFFLINIGFFEGEGLFFTIFKPLIKSTAPFIGILLVFYGIRFKSFLKVATGLVFLAATLIFISSRGAFIYSFVTLAILLYVFAVNRKLFVSYILVFSGVFFTYYLIVGGIPKFTVNDAGITINIDSDKKMDRSAFEEIRFRFSASTLYSTGFLMMEEKGIVAGINPIAHSLSGIVPRKYWPEKPIPSTLNPNDIYSQGMYLIYKAVEGEGSTNMVEFSSAAHSYWEMGLFWVAASSFIAGFYVFLSIKIAGMLKHFGIVYLLSTLKPFGYMDPKMWTSEIILQIYQIMLPALILYLFFYFMRILAKLFTSEI